MARLQAIAAAPASARPRVLIVDDSAVARAVLTRMVEDGATCTVADAVPDIASALRFLAAGRVDVILLDLEMPGVHGLAGLPDIIAAGAGAKVLVVSSAAGEGAAATIEALALGAADTLVKPGRCVSAGSFAAALAEKLVRLGERTEPSPRPAAAHPAAHHDIDVVAIGASTGGIHAINSLLLALPRTFRKPIVITQHLPSSFIPYFAEQVAIATGRRCQVAADTMALHDDMILVAPGDAHVTAVRAPGGGAAIRLSQASVANGNMPSVDPMFETFAECFGARMMAVVLSGMGRDGLAGARLVRSAGGTVVVQDQASSVVWGMPGAVAAAGLASAVLPPEAIGGYIAGQHGAIA
ncbi:chemotaxis protein CheB [Sphingomonas mucosissima]|uniref:protein-glutamate methylesterase n=1 Tax=Sphingomonas mucosissima TaxID=370959 RepID=A0A245ZR78_9SPHN|nr:chemotaxis protein CheB [Sphingomonas mucosissima]OWK32244.1 chemotaxis response regulator protein-glutamate methylesterase [Sphingomonas mucosissima]